MKKYLVFLFFSVAFLSCGDEFENAEKTNSQEEISIRGDSRGGGPDNGCNCESLSPPVIIKTSTSEEGCCEYSVSVAANDQTKDCKIYLQVTQNGVPTTQIEQNEVSTTITLCGEESVTISVMVEGKNQVFQCWTRTLECSSFPCGCDVEIINDGCEVSVCVDKNSCNLWGRGIWNISQPGFDWDGGDIVEDDDYKCLIFTATADIDYVIRVKTDDDPDCIEDFTYRVEGCLDCSNPHWDVNINGPNIDVFCDQADGLPPFSLTGTCTLYNYSHTPPTMLFQEDKTFNFDRSWGVGVHLPFAYSQDCENYAVDDHLHFEYTYEITDSGDCNGNQSGSFVDYYIVQDYDLIPCCFVPDPCDFITCDEGEMCVNGVCVPDPCWGVVCPPWGPCENGLCTG